MASIAGGNRRALVIGGIAVLVLAGAAAAWYFLFGQEPPPAPQPVARVQVRKPAPKPVAPPRIEEAPIPKTANAAVAEVLARSGLDTFAQHYREGALQSIDNPPPGTSKFTPADVRAFREAVNRVLADDKLNSLLTEQLERSFEPIQFGRFIRLLRQPIAEKMTKLESQTPAAAEVKQFVDKLKANPPSQDRRDLIQRIDVATGSSEWASDMSVAVTRSMVEGALAASGEATKDAMRDVARDMTQLRRQMQTQIHTLLFYVYREASDAELKQYAELLESETGRWGTTMLANALKSVIESSGRELGTEIAKIAVARRDAMAGGKRVETAEAPKPEKPEATEAIKTMSRAEAMAMHKAEPQPAAKAEAQAEPKPRRAPAAAYVYRRPPNLPVLYEHYNDLVSAVWMGDFPAARELLDDGKNPNARDADGNTALMIAALRGDFAMARLLLTRGADATAGKPGGETPLELAERAGNFDITRLLRSHGAKR